MLHLRGVTKRYGGGESEVTALAEVDLDVGRGEMVVVLGPSGCGKTTLLNVVGALDSPTGGTVEVAGQEITGLDRAAASAYRRHTVALIFQTFNLFPGLTAEENVSFGAELAGRGPQQVSEALDAVGLGDRRTHFPHELSGGEQQRVAIARALASENPLLLADEPTGELDYVTGRQILALLVDQARAGRTVLMVTHNREIARAADRVVTMSGGGITADEPPPGGPVAAAELVW
jgi:putative ABC transport system ATP-binding protein